MPKAKHKTGKKQKVATSPQKGDVLDTMKKIHSLWENDHQVCDGAWLCRSRLLAFLSRTQRETESAATFLISLKKLAQDLGLQSEEQVVSQFIIGTGMVH